MPGTAMRSSQRSCNPGKDKQKLGEYVALCRESCVHSDHCCHRQKAFAASHPNRCPCFDGCRLLPKRFSPAITRRDN